MNMAECPVCFRYILSHSKVVICGICKYVFYLKCISLNTEEQSCITTQEHSWYCTSCITEIFPFNFIEDDKIFLAEINNYDLKCRVIELSDAPFQPYEVNSDDFYSPNYKFDPDINFYHEINYQIGPTCNYYMEDAFSSIIKNRYNYNEPEKIFSLCHLNIRSLQANLNDFDMYLKSLDFEFSCIGVSETWLHDGNCDLYDLTGYAFAERHRQTRKCVGVGIYVKYAISFQVRNDLHSSDDVFNQFS